MNYDKPPRPLLSRIPTGPYYEQLANRVVTYINSLSAQQLAMCDLEIRLGVKSHPCVPLISDRGIFEATYVDENGIVMPCVVYEARYDGARSAWNLNPGLDALGFKAGSINGYLTDTHVAVVVKALDDDFSPSEGKREVLQMGAALEAQLNELIRQDDAFGLRKYKMLQDLVDHRRGDPSARFVAIADLMAA